MRGSHGGKVDVKKYIKWIVIGAVVACGLAFILCNLYKSSRPPKVTEPPDLNRSPARVYGRDYRLLEIV